MRKNAKRRPKTITDRVSAADARGGTVAYRDEPGHTVALQGLHRECAVANHSITGTDRNHFAPHRAWFVALPGIYERTRIQQKSSGFVPFRRLQTAGSHRGDTGTV